MRLILLLLLLVCTALGLQNVNGMPRPSKRTVCNVVAYGANTSSIDNTKALQAAITACLRGGVVVVPAGEFRTHPLAVHNGVDFTLMLQPGAVLRALPREGWPLEADGKRCVDFLSFVNCTRCMLQGSSSGISGDNTSGTSIVDGQGTEWYRDFDDGKLDPDVRPMFVVVDGGSDFKLLDVTLLNAPKYNVLLRVVAGAEVARVNITSQWYDGGRKEPHNTDGINPGWDSHDVWIHDCYISNGDDSIAVKMGTVDGGCTRNILVENCEFHNGHGCIRDVDFRNITMSNQQNGCRVKLYDDEKDGSGAPRNGFADNITWDSITMVDTGRCIFVDPEWPSPVPTDAGYINVSRLHFKHMKGTCSKTDVTFSCPAAAPCKDIDLNDVHLSGGKGVMECDNAFGTAVDVSPASCLSP